MTVSAGLVSTGSPSITVFAQGTQQNLEGDIASVPVLATDTNPSATLTYSATNLPPGLSINLTSGLITGTIANGAASSGDDLQGDYAVVVSATDGTTTGTAAIAWAVSPRIVVQVADQQNIEGDSVNLPVLAMTPDNTTLTYSATNLPTGLSISPTSGVITGTIPPGASTGGDDGQGEFSTTITVTDGTYSAITQIEWSISPRIAVQLADQQNIEGDSVNLQVQASTPDNTTLTYSAVNLPTGLSINPNGLITGTISAGASSGGDGYGDCSTTITVTDGT